MLKIFFTWEKQSKPRLLLLFSVRNLCVAIFLLGTWSFGPAIAQNAPVSESEARPLVEAFSAIDAKQYKEAESKLHLLATSSNPYLATMACEGLAHLYRMTGEFSKSRVAYECAISKQVASPEKVNYFYQTAGQAAVMAGEYDVAVQHLEKWLVHPETTRKPSKQYGTGLSYLAIAQAERHQFEEAVVTIDRAVSSVERPSNGLLVIQSAIKNAAAAPDNFKNGSIAALVRPKSY